jgi:hypothetical protein
VYGFSEALARDAFAVCGSNWARRPRLFLWARHDLGNGVGSVTDSTGAAVPNAHVQLLNVATNAGANTTTNRAGEFTFANVAPGNYKLTITSAGFRTHTVANLAVEVNKSAMFSSPPTDAREARTQCYGLLRRSHQHVYATEPNQRRALDRDGAALDF